MGVVNRKCELFEDVVRLRRAGRALPGNPDISTVRANLERELGETVSRRMAARLLVVSHTALDRWIAAGDVPVVPTPSGRLELPVPALLELRDAVEGDRAGGPRRYPLTAAINRQRDAARRLRAEDLDVSVQDGGHDRARARGLAYHRALARKLRRPLVDEARHTLRRWRQQSRIDERYASRWEELLTQPIPEVRRLIVEESPAADDLRQNSPFAGLLSEPERQRIVREVR